MVVTTFLSFKEAITILKATDHRKSSVTKLFGIILKIYVQKPYFRIIVMNIRLV